VFTMKRRRVRRRLLTMPLLGLIYCRRLQRWPTGRTAAYHVGTRQRRAFLFMTLLAWWGNFQYSPNRKMAWIKHPASCICNDQQPEYNAINLDHSSGNHYNCVKSLYSDRTYI